ncbi:MAG: RDD family protein [Armatimonadetes bacterium]|nr:RDD family protein [Armatimonadota bacterium]
MDSDDIKTVITPEQVAVTYRLAGIGTRFAAVLVDTIIHVLLLAALLLGLSMVSTGVGEFLGWLELGGSSWLFALALLIVFAVFWGYFIFWETVWTGQTPGKKLTGIRVMRDTGHPIDFRAAFVRNILRYVDFLPGGYGVGTVVMFLSRDSKRLGDYAAGTIVVMSAPVTPEVATGEQPIDSRYALLGDPALLNLRALTREQLSVIDRFLERRESLPEHARAHLARQVAEPLMSALDLEAHSPTYDYEQLLVELALACRRRDEMRTTP